MKPTFQTLKNNHYSSNKVSDSFVDGEAHIDLIEPTTSTAVCHSACYFDTQEIWFWPLD